jgi:hypothetical protein
MLPGETCGDGQAAPGGAQARGPAAHHARDSKLLKLSAFFSHRPILLAGADRVLRPPAPLDLSSDAPSDMQAPFWAKPAALWAQYPLYGD